MEGAGFAFDTANMDFDLFATMPQQQQQSFAKPNEDNTSGFFFGDEGIDTAASFVDPTVFSNPSQDMSFIPQNLAMDNTMSNTMWNSHLTPESLIMNSFPATPTQPMYQSFGTTSSLGRGKRSLQLDVEDFPQSKRHESNRHDSTGDYTLSSFSSASPQIDVTGLQGLSDEAADVCTTWFNKYAVLPSDKHIDSLSQLTGESSDAIRQWFGRLLKQGMGGQDSAYKSQTEMMPALCWSDSYTTDLVPQQQHTVHQQLPTPQLTQENTATPERRPSDDTTTQPASTLRGGKKRCTPTEDRDLLARDPNKIYQCTRKCGKRYGRKCDWKRNEEEGYPCKSWVCSLCVSEGVENVRPCFRKYHFVQHFRNIHPDVNSDEYEQSSIVCSETEFPRNCGFCKHKFDSRQDRIDHIADHFKQGKCMLDWKDESNDDSSDSDNNDDNDNDNDDDKPSGDGFDSAPSHPPPESDPRDNFGTKYYGGGDYGGGGSSSGGNGSGSLLLPDSFFQFQLSSRPENADITKQDEQQLIQQQPSSTPEPDVPESLPEPTPGDVCSMRGKQKSTARDDQTSLAGDALSGRLVGGAKVPSQPLVARGVCVSKDGVGVIPDAAIRQPTLPDTHSSSTGRNTIISPTVSSALQPLEKQGVPTPTVPKESVSQTKGAPLPPAVLDTLQHFTPQSFLSVRLLGAGGFSTVDEVLHRATNLRLGRKTLKNRDQSAIEELKKEVSVLQKLRHPHVIRFLGAYSKGDKMSILVSPVAETTLQLWLEQATLQQPANLVNVISKMFGCLVSSIRYLHEQRPVVKHMDIKPQNILIAQGDQEFPHVVLCDFGISSSTDDLSDGQHKPLTRRYVAPEVFEGFTRKQAADIWSLGCVFAEMASAPFGQFNSKWLTFRREYSGHTGKHYWQDVPALQDWLSSFLEEAATPTEQEVVGTLKEMLQADPNERPSAALLSLKFTPAPCCLEWPNDKAIFPAPDQELEAVEMLVRKDGVDCCDHLDVVASVTDDYSQDVFKNAKCWIEECSHTHDSCRQLATTDGTLPTRLVDTQPEGIDDSIVRVVDSASLKDLEAVQYATLSHVWDETTITLTTDRLQNARLGLQRRVLPKPLESGIEAAQKLGFRYIWIDSLCIVQDSEKDKRNECAKMASVFRNAALTIVLDQIDELRSEKPTIIKMTPDIVLPNANANALIQNANTTGDRPSASATLPVTDFTTSGFGWDTRAWALQERLLSRRLLHLCERQLYWECASLKASDTFPRGLSSLVWEKAHSKSRHDRPQHGKSGCWQSMIVKNVSNKQTSFEATRLRNCQWIHEEGGVKGESMDVAHTVMQPGEAKTPLGSKASKGFFAPVHARKNSGVGTAPSTKSTVSVAPSTNASVGLFNATGPWTGTAIVANDARISPDRLTSPFLKGLFGLSSMSDSQTCHVDISGAHKKGLYSYTQGPIFDSTDAHPALSKVYRGSENTRIDLSVHSQHVHHTGPKLRKQQITTSTNLEGTTSHTPSNCVGVNAAPFWDSDSRRINDHRAESVTGHGKRTRGSQPKDIAPNLALNTAGVNDNDAPTTADVRTGTIVKSVDTNCDDVAIAKAHQLESKSHSHPRWEACVSRTRIHGNANIPINTLAGVGEEGAEGVVHDEIFTEDGMKV